MMHDVLESAIANGCDVSGTAIGEDWDNPFDH